MNHIFVKIILTDSEAAADVQSATEEAIGVPKVENILIVPRLRSSPYRKNLLMEILSDGNGTAVAETCQKSESIARNARQGW